jgi:hypothetical protein
MWPRHLGQTMWLQPLPSFMKWIRQRGHWRITASGRMSLSRRQLWPLLVSTRSQHSRHTRMRHRGHVLTAPAPIQVFSHSGHWKNDSPSSSGRLQSVAQSSFRRSRAALLAVRTLNMSGTLKWSWQSRSKHVETESVGK